MTGIDKESFVKVDERAEVQDRVLLRRPVIGPFTKLFEIRKFHTVTQLE